AARGLDLAQKAVAIEPRYSWAQIALARALLADRHPLEAERALRFAQQYSRFPTLNYELANVLASMGLYDEAAQELARSFTLKGAQDFIAGEDGMRTFRLVYVAGKFVRKGVALSSVVDLMDNAIKSVEAALSVPAATVAVQPEELSDIRARARAQGATPDVPD